MPWRCTAEKPLFGSARNVIFSLDPLGTNESLEMKQSLTEQHVNISTDRSGSRQSSVASLC
jgi:hypothetical protein